MSSNYLNLINSLHNGSDPVQYYDGDIERDTTQFITVNKRREFDIPAGFNTTIAYEGDMNTQVITFVLPETHEGHLLSDCQIKEIRWKHLSSNIEGISPLDFPEKPLENTEGTFRLVWEVPAEACVVSGNLEVAIRIRDMTEQGRPAFVWNTASYSGFTIGKSMNNVSKNFPAKDEILIIDGETKDIAAPQGYNNTICLYGDVGAATVYFLVNRYLGKKNPIDLLGDGTQARAYAVLNGYKRRQSLEIIPYTTGLDKSNDKDGLVLVIWQPAAELTTQYGPGSIEASIEFTVAGEAEGYVSKRWFSNPYSKLNIAPSILQNSSEPGLPPDINVNVFEEIDSYFEVQDVTFDSN